MDKEDHGGTSSGDGGGKEESERRIVEEVMKQLHSRKAARPPMMRDSRYEDYYEISGRGGGRGGSAMLPDDRDYRQRYSSERRSRDFDDGRGFGTYYDDRCTAMGLPTKDRLPLPAKRRRDGSMDRYDEDHRRGSRDYDDRHGYGGGRNEYRMNDISLSLQVEQVEQIVNAALKKQLGGSTPSRDSGRDSAAAAAAASAAASSSADKLPHVSPQYNAKSPTIPLTSTTTTEKIATAASASSVDPSTLPGLLGIGKTAKASEYLVQDASHSYQVAVNEVNSILENRMENVCSATVSSMIVQVKKIAECIIKGYDYDVKAAFNSHSAFEHCDDLKVALKRLDDLVQEIEVAKKNKKNDPDERMKETIQKSIDKNKMKVNTLRDAMLLFYKQRKKYGDVYLGLFDHLANELSSYNEEVVPNLLVDTKNKLTAHFHFVDIEAQKIGTDMKYSVMTSSLLFGQFVEEMIDTSGANRVEWINELELVLEEALKKMKAFGESKGTKKNGD